MQVIMTSLDTLPADIFSYIGSKLEMSDLGQLWFCSHTIQHLIKHVLELVQLKPFTSDISAHAMARHLQRFPKISKLHMLVNLIGFHPLPGRTADFDCKTHLPSTLRELRLSILKNQNLGTAIFSILPESLTLLELGTSSGSIGHSIISSQSLASLPSSLTTLKIPHVIFGDIYNCISILPKGLVHLNILRNVIVGTAHILPPSLQSLAFTLSDMDSLKSLPSSLVTLKVLEMSSSSQSITKNADFSASLPVHLTKFTLLGHTLTKSHTPQTFLRDLPPSILTLKIPFSMDAADLQDLPPMLTRLCTPPGKIDDHGWQYLPKSITLCDGQTLTTDLFYESLPRGLKQLSVVDHSDRRYPNDISSKYFEHLPQYLTELSLAGHTLLGSSSDQKILPLPETITRLSLHNVTPWLTIQFAQNLPPRLDYFKIMSNPTIVLPEKFIYALPRTVRELILINVKVTDDCVPDLPRNLQKLTIEDINSPLSDLSVQYFPRTLKRLSLIGAALHTDASMKDMPRGLQALFMPNNNNLTMACLDDIPKFLLHLNVDTFKGFQQQDYLKKPPGQYFFYTTTSD
jgi:hypothetical protein